MAQPLSDAEIEEALAVCADEPVHIPGNIQPFGWLLADDREGGTVRYASENAPDLFARPLDQILGAGLVDLLGKEVWHALQNTANLVQIAEKRSPVGIFDIEGQRCDLHAFQSGEYMVLEIEADTLDAISAGELMKDITFLVDQVQPCQDQGQLLDMTARLMRHTSGFDRVMIYRFDQDFNGEVMAEARRVGMDPMLGLRFPHWDIPAQAREIMKRLPLRLICDVDQAPVPLRADDLTRGPLDISLAQTRGLTEVHMQYLRNMGTVATMTLSVMVEGDLWGMISFHHARPRVATPYQRGLLTGFLAIFCLKLG
jgi:light-regulated signal transduction histidine kinase (bacteriophytochrome)